MINVSGLEFMIIYGVGASIDYVPIWLCGEWRIR
jgi:hypothetical protein